MCNGQQASHKPSQPCVTCSHTQQLCCSNSRSSKLSNTLQVALADLLQFNPSANVNAPVAPGTTLTRPCYPNNSAPSYLGALLQLSADMLAARI